MLPNEPGTYVALELDTYTRTRLDDFVTNELKLPNPVDPKYYHTTVIYSEQSVAEAYKIPKEYYATATGIRYELFTTKQGKKCLTLLVESYQARALNTHLTMHGATSNYPSYTPHLTLSYDYTGPDITTIPLPKFTIAYDTILAKPLDINFVPPTKQTTYITLED